MNIKRYLIASLTVSAWLLIYGFLVNGVLLADFWETQTAPGLMRAEGEEIMSAVMASFVLQGIVLTFIFTRGYENKGWSEGARFGLLIACFMASLYLLFYGIQPWTITSMMVSITADGLMYVGAGILLSLIYRQ